MKFLAGTLGVVAMLLPQIPAGGMKAAQAVAPAAQQAPAGRRAARGERHPEIRGAIRALARAKRRLEAAAHDFGGHRVEALAAVNKAIEQLRIALQYDKD